MPIRVRTCELREIEPLRELYRAEMNCQIIHDSIHVRKGWTLEYALEEEEGRILGYGSVAIAGPWKERPTLYEFFLAREHRSRTFEVFSNLLARCGAVRIETQSNDASLTTMLHIFARNLETEAILFEDGMQTALHPQGAGFRATVPEDEKELREMEQDEGWVVTLDGRIVGSGGVLYHYNRPYGDVYMKVAEPFRQRGLGSYLVQELKAVCRAGGSVPAARTGIGNLISRKCLQRAGFIPCGVLLGGDIESSAGGAIR